MDKDPTTIDQVTESEPLDINNDPEALKELFALDTKISTSSGAILPLETAQELKNFLLNHNSDTYVWKDNSGRLCSCISVVVPNDKDSLEILNIGVDPDLQGAGLGGLAIKFAENLAIQSNKERITLVTAKINEQAIHFYEKHGFAVVGDVEDVYSDGLPRFIMEKLLLPDAHID